MVVSLEEPFGLQDQDGRVCREAVACEAKDLVNLKCE